MKEGEGGGEGKKPHPFPALLIAPFFARSLTLVPRSLLLNLACVSTPATQATYTAQKSLLRRIDQQYKFALN